MTFKQQRLRADAPDLAALVGEERISLAEAIGAMEGGALNWWGLLPTFSWNGYEPDWVPICVGAFLVMMLLAIFGNVSRRRRRQR